MKKVLLVATMFLLLVGCGTESVEAASETTPTTPMVTPTAEAVSETTPITPTVTPAEAIEVLTDYGIEIGGILIKARGPNDIFPIDVHQEYEGQGELTVAWRPVVITVTMDGPGVLEIGNTSEGLEGKGQWINNPEVTLSPDSSCDVSTLPLKVSCYNSGLVTAIITGTTYIDDSNYNGSSILWAQSFENGDKYYYGYRRGWYEVPPTPPVEVDCSDPATECVYLSTIIK